MASVDKELEQQLREAGNKLAAELPSSVDQLLPLLDKVETLLARVEQSPPVSMQDAYAPSVEALVKDKLLRHPDFDVKVAVASCISEITRITAPDAPYPDDTMKDVFQLIVSSFENLADKSSRSFSKLASILETVAKVRSCVVMLDLECDGLIVEMFQHFFKSIREYHSENVFTSMETIMSLVLEESEDIPLELLTQLLASVKNDSEDVLPIARKLGERVFETCAPKLRPCLLEAVKSNRVSLDDYSKVVTSVCEGATTVERNDDNTIEQSGDERKFTNITSDEAAQDDMSKLMASSSHEPAQEAKESVPEEACPEGVECSADKSSPKPIVSNGIAEAGNEDNMVDPESSKEPENPVNDAATENAAEPEIGSEPENGAKPDNGSEPENGAKPEKGAEPENDAAATDVSLTDKDADDLDTVKSVKSKPKLEQTSKRKGNKTSSVNSVEPSDADKEKFPVDSKSHATSTYVLPVKANEPSGNEETEDGDIQTSPQKTSDTDAINVPSPSPSRTQPVEGCPKKGVRTKEVVGDEEKPASVDEVASDSELRPQKRTGKKGTGISRKTDNSVASVGTSQNEAEITNESELKPPKQSGMKGESSESDAKPLKQSAKKGDSINNNEEKASLRKKVRKGQGRGRGKDTAELTTSLAKDDIKETISLPKSTSKSAKDKDEGSIEETPRVDTKRKRSTPGTGKKRKASATKELAENLVGLKVRVYWPQDKEFYEGVIESYDPATKKHKVFYDDGETEILLLKKERWEEVTKDEPAANEGMEVDDQTPEASPEIPKKKKAKTNPETSAKQEKTPASPKRSRAASSSKGKVTAAKSGRNSKSKEDNKATSASKHISKSEENSGSISQDNSKTTGEGFDDTLKSAMKPKDTSTKSKQDTPKTAGKAKSKTGKTAGGESNTNGSGKAKTSPAKGKETDDSMNKTVESAKVSESLKGKASEASKSGSKKRKARS